MNTGGGGAAARDVRRARGIWSQAAGRHKTAIARARAATLCAGGAAGVSGAASARLMPHSPPAGRTPACLFTSQVYPYLAGPAHYRRPAPRDAEPPERTGVVRTQDAALEPEAHGSTPADAHGSTPADPPPPAVIDTAGRVEQRLRHPLQRYDRPKADEAGRRIEYGATAGEPDRLLRWWQRRAPAAEADADRPAERTEHVVSVRNEGWTAKWIAD